MGLPLFGKLFRGADVNVHLHHPSEFVTSLLKAPEVSARFKAEAAMVFDLFNATTTQLRRLGSAVDVNPNGKALLSVASAFAACSWSLRVGHASLQASTPIDFSTFFQGASDEEEDPPARRQREAPPASEQPKITPNLQDALKELFEENKGKDGAQVSGEKITLAVKVQVGDDHVPLENEISLKMQREPLSDVEELHLAFEFVASESVDPDVVQSMNDENEPGNSVTLVESPNGPRIIAARKEPWNEEDVTFFTSVMRLGEITASLRTSGRFSDFAAGAHPLKDLFPCLLQLEARVDAGAVDEVCERMGQPLFGKLFRGADVNVHLHHPSEFLEFENEAYELFEATTEKLRDLVTEVLVRNPQALWVERLFFQSAFTVAGAEIKYPGVSFKVEANPPISLGNLVDAEKAYGAESVALHRLATLLHPAGMGKHAAVLQENGVSKVEDLAILSEEDLVEIGINGVMDRKRLLALAAGTPLAPPAKSAENIRELLTERLAPAQLETYVEVLVENGVSAISDVALFTDADFKAIGISTLVHRRRLKAIFEEAAASASAATLVAEGGTPMSPGTVPSAGEKAGYIFGKELGRGMFGQVFMARDPRLDRQVAIKVLHPNHSQDPDSREKFLTEARTAAKLKHPNIITIHAVIEVPDLAIVMELIETDDELKSGGPLDALLKKHKTLTAARAHDVICQCLRGLAHAHSHNCLHRDIKPANVMVSIQGDVWTAKLVDFGLAKLVEGSMETGTVCGSPAFMAPEVWGGKVGVGADLWSIGVTLYVMISGRLPFQVRDLVSGQATAPALPLREEDASQYSFLVPATAKALTADVSVRFSSAEEMLAALQASK